jgi:ribose transport system substrate-binding protein
MLLTATVVSYGETLRFGATFHSTYHEFFANMIKGMQDAAEKYDVELTLVDENGDAAAQYNTMENFVEQKMDGIILLAVDPESLVQMVDTIVTINKIPVVACDGSINSDKITTFIGSSGLGMGIATGEAFKAYCEKNNITGGKIGVTTWKKSPSQQERLQGFKDVLATMGNSFVIVNEQDGDARDTAMTSAENIMQADPDISFLYGTNEGNVLGCYYAVEAAGLLDQIKVFGIDVSEDGIKGIRAGYIPFIITQLPYEMGVKSIEVLIGALNGEVYEAKTYIDTPAITIENVDQFVKK